MRPTFRTLNSNLHLLRELIRRDMQARYAGSAFGIFWAILQPLSMVALYWFVFTLMIPVHRSLGGVGYVHFLIAGLLPWLGIHEGLSRGTTALAENGSLLRRLPVQSELLVVVPNVSALLLECVGLAIFLMFMVARGGTLRSLWVLPIALAIQFALQLGLSLILAPVFIFFRDLTQVLGFGLSILFYLSPILYPVAGRFETLFFWNPLTPLLGLFRSALIGAALPPAHSIVFLLIATSAMLSGGLAVFRRARPVLIDII